MMLNFWLAVVGPSPTRLINLALHRLESGRFRLSSVLARFLSLPAFPNSLNFPWPAILGLEFLIRWVRNDLEFPSAFEGGGGSTPGGVIEVLFYLLSRLLCLGPEGQFFSVVT
jgi:hypothetical protein